MAGVDRKFNVYVEFHGQVYGQPTFSQLIYYGPNAISSANSGTVCAAVYADMWPDLKALLSDGYTLNTIQAIIYQDPPSLNKPRFIQVVNEVGSVGGDGLPPHATANMYKIPDNDTIYPDVTPLFNLGRTGWAGVPEGAQVDGLLTDTAVSNFAAAFENFEELNVTFGGTPYTFPLGIIRHQNTISPGFNNPITKVDVAETYCDQRVGTQNSRKY